MLRSRLVAADDDVEEWPISVAANASSTVARRFAVTIPSRRPSSLSAHEHVVHPGAELELVVQRLVVRAVDADELLDVLRAAELEHLRLEPGAADRGDQRLVGDSRPSTVRVACRIEARIIAAGVDEGAVEVEEDDRKAHRPIVAERLTGTSRPAR